MPDYTVVVGNIGTVHSGTNKREATLIFSNLRRPVRVASWPVCR
jgi:hypothetical protein